MCRRMRVFVFRCVGEWACVHAGRGHLSEGVRVCVRIFQVCGHAGRVHLSESVRVWVRISLYLRVCLYMYVGLSGHVSGYMYLFVVVYLCICDVGISVCVCIYLYVFVYLCVCAYG